VRRGGRDDGNRQSMAKPRTRQRNGGQREANKPARSCIFEEQEQYRDFYNERKDESKVNAIYDVEFARELIDFTDFESD
jgi:hypothetical protein